MAKYKLGNLTVNTDGHTFNGVNEINQEEYEELVQTTLSNKRKQSQLKRFK